MQILREDKIITRNIYSLVVCLLLLLVFHICVLVVCKFTYFFKKDFVNLSRKSSYSSLTAHLLLVLWCGPESTLAHLQFLSAVSVTQPSTNISLCIQTFFVGSILYIYSESEPNKETKKSETRNDEYSGYLLEMACGGSTWHPVSRFPNSAFRFAVSISNW